MSCAIKRFLPESRKSHYRNYVALCPNHAACSGTNRSGAPIHHAVMDLTENELQIVLAQNDLTIYVTKIRRILRFRPVCSHMLSTGALRIDAPSSRLPLMRASAIPLLGPPAGRVGNPRTPVPNNGPLTLGSSPLKPTLTPSCALFAGSYRCEIVASRR